MKFGIKQLICTLLAIVMLFPYNIAFATDRGHSVEILDELELAQKVKFSYFHKDYSRAEFAYILCAIDAEYYEDIPDTSLVPDVSEEYARYAEYTVRKGYLSVDEKGNFNPNKSVSYNEAIVALLTLLDYDIIAQKNGGEIGDYQKIANSTGLTKGVSASDGNSLTDKELAALVVNAMNIPPVTLSVNGSKITSQTIFEHMNISVVKGKLLATESRSIGAELCDPGYVNVDGSIFEVNKRFSDDLVGRCVNCYVRSNSTDEVLCMIDKSGESVLLNADEIESTAVSKSCVEIKYKKKKIKIPNTATIMVNGKPGDLTGKLFNAFDTGTIEIIDSDNDGDFDTADMNICITEVVECADAENKVINTKYSKKHLELETNKNDVLVYDSDGDVSTLDIVKADSVISIACDAYQIQNNSIVFDYKNAGIVKVYVSNRKVVGKLEGQEDDEYIVDGRNYSLSPYLEYVKQSGEKNKIKLSDVYTFYLDVYGNICDYDLDDSAAQMQYGYLISARSESKKFKNRARLRILTLNDEFKDYDVRDKYVLDGEKLNLSDADSDNVLPAVLAKRQLIRYRLTDNQIAEIDTTQIGSDEIKDTSLTLDAEKESRRYWENQMGFDGYKICVTPNTKYFIATDDQEADEANYKVGSINDLASSEYFTVEGYDIGDVGDAGCLIIYKNVENEIWRGERAYMVEKCSMAVDEDGNDVCMLKVHGYSGSLTLYTVDLSELAYHDYSLSAVKTVEDIKKGDIVRFTQNANKRINNLERDFAFSVQNEPKYFDILYGDDQSGKAHYGYGQLYQGSNTHFVFTIVDDLSNITDDDKHYHNYTYASKIPVYNVSDGTITLYGGDYSKIPTYLNSARRVTVFLHMSIYQLQSVAVYVWD